MTRLFRLFVPTSVVALFLSELVLIVGCFLAVTYYFYPEARFVEFLLDEHGLVRIVPVLLLVVLSLYFQNLYADLRIKSRVVLFERLLFVIGLTLIGEALIGYIDESWTLPKWVMVVGSGLTAFVLFGWRVVFGASMWETVGRERILFIGCSPTILELATYLKGRPELGLHPIGYLGDAWCTPLEELPHLGAIGDLIKTVRDFSPHRIVGSYNDWASGKLPVCDLFEFRFSGVQTERVSDLYEVTFGRVCMREIVSFGPDIEHDNYRVENLQAQSIYSLIFGLSLLVLSAPLMVGVALLVKILRLGPVLVGERYVGRYNQPFLLYHFGIQHPGIEDRSSKAGLARLILKFRLDELPVLWNVIRGDMALIGPLPEPEARVEYLSARIPHYRQRHMVAPGITGWTQVQCQEGDDTVRLEYDLYYVKYSSLSLDLFILTQFFKAGAAAIRLTSAAPHSAR